MLSLHLGILARWGQNGVAAGIGLFSDASVGLSKHKGTGGEFLIEVIWLQGTPTQFAQEGLAGLAFIFM